LVTARFEILNAQASSRTKSPRWIVVAERRRFRDG